MIPVVALACSQESLTLCKPRQLAGAFDCYAGHVEAIREQRERVGRILSTWKNPGLKRSMEAWYEYMDIVNEERMARHATAGAARLVGGGKELHHLHALHEAGAHDRLVGILLGEQQQRPARPVHVGGWGGGLRQW